MHRIQTSITEDCHVVRNISCVPIGSTVVSKLEGTTINKAAQFCARENSRCAAVFLSAGFFSVQPITESARSVAGI